MNIKEKMSHSVNCGITLKYSDLIIDNFLGVEYWQLICCDRCHKKHIVFRDDINVYIEPHNDNNVLLLENVIKDLKYFFELSEEYKNNNYIIYSNIKEYTQYPLGSNNEIRIEKIDNNNTGETIMINDTFYNFLNYKHKIL